MNEKEILDIIALATGMALGLFASTLVAFMGRIGNRPVRLACSFCAPLCLLSLPSPMLRLCGHRLSFVLDAKRLVALSVMGFALAAVMEIIDRQKKRRQKEKGVSTLNRMDAADRSMAVTATVSPRP